MQLIVNYYTWWGWKSVRPEILQKLSRGDWLKEQKADGTIAKAIQLVTANKHLQNKCEPGDSDEFQNNNEIQKESSIERWTVVP